MGGQERQSWNPVFIRTGEEFSKFSQKGDRLQNFPVKRDGLVKQRVVLRRLGAGGYHELTLILSKVIFFSVCGACVLPINTISISILCVLQEGLSLVKSNNH